MGSTGRPVHAEFLNHEAHKGHELAHAKTRRRKERMPFSFGLGHFSPDGATQDSPGHRPADPGQSRTEALKGRLRITEGPAVRPISERFDSPGSDPSFAALRLGGFFPPFPSMDGKELVSRRDAEAQWGTGPRAVGSFCVSLRFLRPFIPAVIEASKSHAEAQRREGGKEICVPRLGLVPRPILGLGDATPLALEYLP